MYYFIIILIASCLSLLAVSWVYFKMLYIAHEKNLVDHPNSRKLQDQPVPFVGGLCVSFGILISVLFSCMLIDCTGLLPVLLALSIMLFIGCLDDLIGLSASLRLFFESFVVLALIFGGGGCIDSLHGLWGIQSFSWWIAVPLTVFACVGIINSINMIDGVNGLCSGICITCCCLFGYAFYCGDDYPNSMLCFVMASALFPFLLHNVAGKSSKMFIGNAGTMIMGVLMSWCVIQVLRTDSHARWWAYQEQGMNVVALTLAILSVPVFDTIRVMFMRILRGVSPFQADKTHLHHIIYEYCQSHSITSITEIVLNLSTCLVFAIAFKAELSLDFQLYVVILFGAIFIWGAYAFMNRGIRLNTHLACVMRRQLAKARQGKKSWWNRFQIWVDTPKLEP